MCVTSIFHLGFLLYLSITNLCISWVCPSSVHRHGSVRPILQGMSGYNFILFTNHKGFQLEIYDSNNNMYLVCA